MATGSGQWLKGLRALAIELWSAPDGVSQAKQLQQLLEKWRRNRAALDQDYIVQLSFFLGSLSGQVKDEHIRVLIQDLIEGRHAVMSASSTPGPMPSGEPGPSTEAATEPDWFDEEFIDIDHPDEPGSPSFISRPAAPSMTREAPRSSEQPKSTSSKSPEISDFSRADKAPRAPAPGTSDSAGSGSPGGAGGTAKETPNRKWGRRSGERDAGPGYPEVERRVNSAYRLHLDRKHGEIEKLQELLAQKASEALAQNKQFGDLLKTERAALEKAINVNDIDEMKQILIGSADELLSGQQDLEEKLKSSFEYLEVVKSDSEILHNELTKVRMLSLTDENTGLPNRRAFLRRLDEEINRSKQYNIPLTLALIDLDYFKEINDQYGHPAGDAVLNWYAQHGLPIFRHYDMIARYGGEEFAVLFPGTTAEGAGRAIAKLREHVARQTCTYEDQVINVPTFSAGLAAYREGEDEDSLIKRADQALYRAKSQGRDQTALEQHLPPVEGASGREPNGA